MTCYELRMPTDELKLNVPFFLSMEEVLAKRGLDDSFFIWSVGPTVIFGRNQVPEVELDIEYCHAHGIEFYRRKSGGGCVYADRDNLMLSYVCRVKGDVATTFRHFTTKVAQRLQQLGLDATVSGRNDILIGGRKVSGFAYYQLNLPNGSWAIVHGTMLFDTDFSTMSRVLTPSKAKLQAKGVKSVVSRVTTIKEHCHISLDDFKTHLRDMCNEVSDTLPENVLAEINALSDQYRADSWIYHARGSKSTLALANKDNELKSATHRIDEVGELTIELLTDGIQINSLKIDGDFFSTADVDENICSPLCGCRLETDAIETRLSNHECCKSIAGINASTLAHLILLTAKT